jgi:N-acetylneuraminate synthase
MARCEIFADIGINHNGDVEEAIKLARAASLAGCDAVKLQVRTPDIVVPHEHRDVVRQTQWGTMTYMEYRRRIEFSDEALLLFDTACKQIGIEWFASAWDMESWNRLQQFSPGRVKIASAMLGYKPLLHAALNSGLRMYVSTGMHSRAEIDDAVHFLKQNCPDGPRDRIVLLHCNSAYPAANKDIQLQQIGIMRDRYALPIGYSGHERGLQITYAAVALGAVAVERHITMDRTQIGSDHAASVEPAGLMRMVRDIRAIEDAMGGGIDRVVGEQEQKVRDKLRWYRT